MSMERIGAIAFMIWGILHIAGSGFILAELAFGGPKAGFAVYRATENVPELAGATLGYMSYLLLAIGAVVVAIALKMNWQNSEHGLALNTGILLVVEIGLVVFFLLPGHVSIAEAAPGIALFVTGAVCGGIACKQGSHHAE